jgi:hypothetical protein
VWTCLTCGFAETANHLLHTRTKMCVSEKSGFSLIKTRQQRGLLLGPRRETTRSQRPLRERAVFFLRCLGAGRVVVALEVLF